MRKLLGPPPFGFPVQPLLTALKQEGKVDLFIKVVSYPFSLSSFLFLFFIIVLFILITLLVL